MMEYALQSIEYSVEGSKPVVYLYARDVTGKRVLIKDSFRPYFYIRTKDRWKLPTSMSIRRLENGYRSIYGEELTKVEMTIPAMVKLMRERLHKSQIHTYEADIEFVYRYLIDKGITYGFNDKLEPIPTNIAPVCLYFDIEAPNNEVVSITYRCNNELRTMVQGTSKENLCNINCEVYNSEKELLEAFIDAVVRLDPDVLIGWNISYDLGKLNERCKAVGVDSSRMSPMGIWKRDNRGYWKVKGREVFDLMEAFRILIHKEYEESPSSSLQYVARAYLKQEPITVSNWDTIWKTDPVKLVRKNIQDVELMIQVNEKYGAFDLFDEIRRFIGCRLKDTLKKGTIADIMLLRNTPYVLPNKYVHTLGATQEHKSYLGGYRKAERGVYDNVLYLDFKAFYPTIIILYNISIETFGKDSQEEGIVPKLLKKLMALREEKKLLMKQAKTEEEHRKYDIQQYSLKTVVNSIYGQFGFNRSRIYDLKCAETITALARKHIQEVEDLLSLFTHVCYIDTDGAMFPFEGDVNELMSSLSQLIGQFSIELADRYKRVIILDKEQYAALTENGEIKVKGLESVRADWSPYIKDTQMEVFRSVLQGASRDEIIAKVRRAYYDISKQPIHRLKIVKGIKKPIDEYKVQSFHIKACALAERLLGIKWQVGDKPNLIPLEGGIWIAIKSDTELPPEIARKVDFNKIREQFRHAIGQITDLIGIPWSIIEGQTTLA